MKEIIKKIILIPLTVLILSACMVENKEEIKDYTRDDYEYTIENINIIDTYYDKELKNKYEKINEIPTNYKIEEAIKDKCYSKDINGTYNYDVFEEFIRNYNKKEDSNIRMIKYTTEGSPIIYDIKYDSEEDKIIILHDNTRDFYGTKRVEIYYYEKIEEYKGTFLVACNGELTESTINSSNCFVIGDKN